MAGQCAFCLHVYILISWKKRKSSSNGNGIEFQEQQDLKKMWEKVFGLMDEIDGKEERIEECLFGKYKKTQIVVLFVRISYTYQGIYIRSNFFLQRDE